MNRKDHILTALQEQFEHWEALLANLTEEEITTPHFDLDRSIRIGEADFCGFWK